MNSMRRLSLYLLLLPLFCAPIADALEVLGNGGLTVVFSDQGRVESCYWPAPGYYSQLRSDKSNEQVGPSGIQFGFELDGEIEWIGGEDWTMSSLIRDEATVTVKYSYNSRDIEVEQQFTIDLLRDLMTVTVSVAGSDSERIYLYTDFDPMTQLNRRVAVDAHPPEAQMDFVAVVDVGLSRILQFRPLAPGASTLTNARKWIEEQREGEVWKQLGEGSWIGITSDSHVVQSSVGVYAEGFGVLDADTSNGVLGDGHGLLAVDTKLEAERLSASFQIAFGATQESLDAILLSTRNGAESVPEETSTFRTVRDEGRANLKTMLGRLRMLISSENGSVLTSFGDATSGPVVSIQDATYCVYALGLAGLATDATSLLAFLENTVYRDADGKYPLGSVPREVYASGERATPHYEIDLLPAASLIWGIESYSITLEQALQRDHSREHWDTVELVADFLDIWVQPALRNFGATEAIQSEMRADLLEDIGAAYLGLENAIRLANQGGYEIPSSWIGTRQRCQLVLGRAELAVFAPWDIEYGFPAGKAYTTEDLPQESILREILEGKTAHEAMVTLVSLGYQNYSALEREQWIRFQLRGVIDGYLANGVWVDEADYRAEAVAMFIAILYQSYQ